MIGVYVVVAGLVAVVPGYDQAANRRVIDILVLNTGKVQSDSGVPIASHRSYMVLSDYTPAAKDIKLERSALKPLQVLDLALEGQASLGPWELREEDRMPIMQRFYGNLPFRGNRKIPIEVRKECLDGKPECVDAGGEPLLSAKLRLSGRWTMTPVEVNEEGGILRDVIDESEYSLIGLGASLPRFASHVLESSPGASTGRLRRGSGPLAGGLVISASVRREELTALMNENDLVLETSTDCEDFEDLGEAGASSCLVISIVNMPYMNAYEDAGCDELPVDRVDVHFDRYYDLLVNPPVLRLLPLLSSLDSESCCAICKCCKGGSGDPPGIKCFDTVIMGVSP